MEKFIYVVWAPSAQWADGIAPAGYSASHQEAEALLRELAEEEEEYGPAGPYSVSEIGYIEKCPVSKFVGDDPIFRKVFSQGGVEALVEYLNSLPL